MDDKLAFLDNEPETEINEPEAPAAVVEPEIPAEPEAAPEKPRDEQGRFAKVEKSDETMVPLKALHETRDKMRDLEAQLARLTPRQEAPKTPDIFENPEGFAEHQLSAAQQMALNVKLDLSEEAARDKFGDEAVDKARDWALGLFAQRPGFQQEVYNQRNPYRYVVEAYQREQIASQVSTDDFAQFQAWKAAQGQLQAQPAQAAPAAPPSPAPPVSIAAAPSAGGVQHTATGPGVAFDEIFRR